MSNFGGAGVVDTGFGSVPVASPTFNASGLSPAILNLAKSMSRQGMEEAQAFSASRGTESSSFNTNALNRAWYQGLQGAIGTAQAEQQRVDAWSRAMLSFQADTEQDSPSIFESAMTGAATGATIGGSAAGGVGAGHGAWIGAVAGGLGNWLGGF